MGNRKARRPKRSKPQPPPQKITVTADEAEDGNFEDTIVSLQDLNINDVSEKKSQSLHLLDLPQDILNIVLSIFYQELPKGDRLSQMKSAMMTCHAFHNILSSFPRFGRSIKNGATMKKLFQEALSHDSSALSTVASIGIDFTWIISEDDGKAYWEKVLKGDRDPAKWLGAAENIPSISPDLLDQIQRHVKRAPWLLAMHKLSKLERLQMRTNGSEGVLVEYLFTIFRNYGRDVSRRLACLPAGLCNIQEVMLDLRRGNSVSFRQIWPWFFLPSVRRIGIYVPDQFTWETTNYTPTWMGRSRVRHFELVPSTSMPLGPQMEMMLVGLFAFTQPALVPDKAAVDTFFQVMKPSLEICERLSLEIGSGFPRDPRRRGEPGTFGFYVIPAKSCIWNIGFRRTYEKPSRCVKIIFTQDFNLEDHGDMLNIIMDIEEESQLEMVTKLEALELLLIMGNWSQKMVGKKLDVPQALLNRTNEIHDQVCHQLRRGHFYMKHAAEGSKISPKFIRCSR